jgi:hypothetical protein
VKKLMLFVRGRSSKLRRTASDRHQSAGR